MISLAGLGEAFALGDASGGEVSVGVGAVLGVATAAGVEGVASGEFDACWLLGSVQPANMKTNPTTRVAGTTPLLTRP